MPPADAIIPRLPGGCGKRRQSHPQHASTTPRLCPLLAQPDPQPRRQSTGGAPHNREETFLHTPGHNLSNNFPVPDGPPGSELGHLPPSTSRFQFLSYNTCRERPRTHKQMQTCLLQGCEFYPITESLKFITSDPGHCVKLCSQ